MLLLLIAAEFSVVAGSCKSSEQRAEMTAKASSDNLTLTLGAADFAGPQAPQRQEIALGAQVGVFKADLRAVPPAAGLQRISAELGVHFETVSLVLGARTASLDRMDLRGAGARAEIEGQLDDDIRAGLSASAWALQLQAPSTSRAWLDWGMRTTDWAQRAEIGGWISIDFTGLFSVTPSLSLAQSAQP